MNILYCGDKNIKDGLIISILSLLKNVNEKLNIYVLTINMKTGDKNIEGVSPKVIQTLDQIIKNRNKNNSIKLINITNLFEKEIPEINIDTRFTPCCMLRLYADQLEELPEKILYLDNDVICRKDPAEFYNQDIKNYEIIGVLDYYGKWFFKNNIFKFDYINSGVLLLNLKKIKETNLFYKCRKMCQSKKIFMPDQSSLNKLSKYKKIVGRQYNDQRRLHEDTVFQHFTTSFRLFPILHTVTIKPWHINNLHEKLKIFEYDDILEEYKKIINNVEMLGE